MKKLPKKNVKERNKVLKTFELPEAENEILIQSSEKLGISQAQFIRRAIEEKIRRSQNGSNNMNLTGIQDILEALLFNQEKASKEISQLNKTIKERDHKISEIISIDKQIAGLIQQNGISKSIEIVREAFTLNKKPLTMIELQRITGLTKALTVGVIGKMKEQELIRYTRTGKLEMIKE